MKGGDGHWNQDLVLWVWLVCLIHVGTNSNIFSAKYSKRYCKNCCCGPFGAEHTKGYQNYVF